LSVWDIERLESFVYIRGVLELAKQKISICVAAGVVVEGFLHGHFVDHGGVEGDLCSGLDLLFAVGCRNELSVNRS
jgi:hypothetical protein